MTTISMGQLDGRQTSVILGTHCDMLCGAALTKTLLICLVFPITRLAVYLL